LSESLVAELYNALDMAAVGLSSNQRDNGLAGDLRKLAEKVAQGGGDAITLRPRAALVDTLKAIATELH
jgi:hypothetical protein